MPSRSRLTGVLGMVLVAALCDGCTEPQTGVLTKSWCQPQSPSTVMLDDLEDGDAASCDKTVAHWGGIDILVGNAGINPYFGPTSGISDEAYARSLIPD